jgi:hypothetical protein
LRVDLASRLAAAVDGKCQGRNLKSLAGTFSLLGLAEQTLGEKLLQISPALLGHEVSLHRGVPLSVRRIKNDHPAETGMIFVVLILEIVNVVNARQL